MGQCLATKLVAATGSSECQGGGNAGQDYILPTDVLAKSRPVAEAGAANAGRTTW
jgi:hypothetical protein